MARPLVLFARALRLRCPACGGGPLFKGWFDMRPTCPSCGLRLEREEGYFLGAMLLNVIVAELLFVAAFAATLVLTWPHPPWQLLTWVSMLGVVGLPLLLFPLSRTVWLAFDLWFRPPARDEHQPLPPPGSSAGGS